MTLTFEQILGRVALAIRFMAGFSLATGVVVLIGAIATTRFQRIREGVLLRTLGATRSQVLRVVFVEYLALGVLSALMAVVLASRRHLGPDPVGVRQLVQLPVPALARAGPLGGGADGDGGALEQPRGGEPDAARGAAKRLNP